MKNKAIGTVLVLSCIILSLGACAPVNKRTESRTSSQTNEEQIRIKLFQEEVKQSSVDNFSLDHTLTLQEAIGRAIKYNLDYKIQLMSNALALVEHKKAALAYLPELTASAGYSSRDNYSGARSLSLLSGEQSLEYSTSQEKDHSVSSLMISWDLIDFGLAYYSRQQTSDKMVIAEEERRKVLQNMVQDVQEAYWRAYMAQELAESIASIIADTERSSAYYEKLGKAGKIIKSDSLSQQRDILQIRYNMRSLQEQLSQGKIHLAALINLPTSVTLKLQPLSREIPPAITADLERLEESALLNRPELRMEDAKLAINKSDVRKSILETVPHLELWAGYNYDSNEYLYNNDWTEAGIRVSWNLFNATDALGKRSVYKANENLIRSKQMSLSMAIITQVHLAANRYQVARDKYNDALQLENISSELADLYKKDVFREGSAGYKKIKSALQATSAKMDSMLAYAELQNAMVRVCNTIGIDPIEGAGEDLSLTELSGLIQNNLKKTTELLQ